MHKKQGNRRLKHIYGNCVMLDPHDVVLCRCSQERASWYLNKGLAEVQQEDPFTIKLKFQPRGQGNAGSLFYCSAKLNQCVVCGDTELAHLTKHHIVPYWIRRHLPAQYSQRNSYDVLPVCRGCHDIYENHAQKLSHALMQQDADRIIALNEHKRYCELRGLAMTLVKLGDKLPCSRSSQILGVLKEFWGQNCIGRFDVEVLLTRLEQDIEKYAAILSGTGKRIAAGLVDIDAFVIFWRAHFVNTMNPRFLPVGWDMEYCASRIS